MPELVDFYQGELTQPISSWDRHARLWDAPDVLASATLGTGTKKLVAPQVKIIEYNRPLELVQEDPFDIILAAIRTALDLVRLPNGWNSYGAKPVSPEAARHTITFLVHTASVIPNIAAPAVVPTVRGGIQLEWHQNGMDLEIGFSSSGPTSWYAEDRETGETSEEPVIGHEGTFLQWLNRVSD